MSRRKLNYRFHDPNTAEATADYIVRLFIEANQGKVEQALKAAADRFSEAEQEANRRAVS